MRVLLGAFGDPGHAFPLIALGGIVSLWSCWEWAATERALREGHAPPRSRLSVVVALTIAAVAFVAFVVAAVGDVG